MPTKPIIKTLTNSSVDILNAIRNNATTDYKHYVPVATSDVESLRTIGAVIMDNPQLQNEFLSAIVNRIGRVIVTSKSYTNPWAIFKKGMLEYGETIEEIFVNIAKPFNYSPELSETNVFKREISDVKAAFHVLNYQKYYKATIQDKDLAKAFLSWSGITDLISKIVDAMYTAANYEEYQTMKYMLAKNILNGRIRPVEISETPASAVSTIKSASNKMTFLSDKSNIAGVMNKTDKNEQYVILDTNFDASIDVNVLATAFNMDKAEFMGHRVLIDGFGNLDTERLNVLFEGDATYEEISQDDLNLLNSVPAVLVDASWFMVIDNLVQFTEQYNGEGLYWNYWYHVWKTFSVSPFANANAFVYGKPEVTGITITPSVATIAAGATMALKANVTTNYFAPQTVEWSVDSEYAEINPAGVLVVKSTATAETVITVTARSTFNSTITGTASITVA